MNGIHVALQTPERRANPASALHFVAIEAHAMLSFRNRLLILLIGLLVSAETVTFFTALARTKATERQRADAQLVAGAHIAQQLLEYRERLLANAVAVLATDFGMREAVSQGDSATVGSALANHARRIGADLTLALDLNGKLMARGEDAGPLDPQLVAAITRGSGGDSDGAQFIVGDEGVQQVFIAPVLAPDEIGHVAMGFAVDDSLARELRDLVGVDVAFLSGNDLAEHVDSASMPVALEGGPRLRAQLREAPTVVMIGSEEYLATAKHLATSGASLDLALLKPMREVMAPYRLLAMNLGLIIGVTLAAAVLAGIYLGRSAARPVQQLAASAARVAAGDYSSRVEAGGGREFANLAQAFNTMQTDIAERETRLRHVARHDGPTGLPNRLHAEEWLGANLADLPPGQNLGVVLIAITNLQEISAGLGFDIAGELVRHLAASLGRLSAGNRLVARVDAAHFLVAVCPLPDAAITRLLAEVRELARRPLATAGVTLQPAVVLGAALAPQHGAAASELLRCAEAALETAIQQKQPQALFERASDEAQRRALKLGADLPNALQSGQLYLVFQPKFRMSDRSPRGVETLVRWQHPEFGKVPPAEFVRIAERTGTCGMLTRWVLREALQQLAAWQRQDIHIDMAVNLSAGDIIDPGMLEYILGELRDSKLTASALTVEITESVLLQEPELARRNMELLRVAGVRFSIDDFGTGYSSLSQLRELPADEVKIDQSFVRAMLQGPEHSAVIRAIIELGHGLGLRAVAEGVEQEAQWRQLAELGCDYVQGYLTGRPQSAGELTPQLLAAAADEADSQSTAQTAALRVLELRRRQ
jgi:predicted signal transduction protein with EAL and GGDEF domain